jgi:hypothetical protein
LPLHRSSFGLFALVIGNTNWTYCKKLGKKKFDALSRSIIEKAIAEAVQNNGH